VRVLVQRVTSASVNVDGKPMAAIGSGLLLLSGIAHSDTSVVCQWMASKIANLRIFDDAAGNMNLSALDLNEVSGSSVAALVVSQFTLYADTRRGRRPGFSQAARPEMAEPLINAFASALGDLGLDVSTGRFGAYMHVELVNDGPVTIWIDSDDLMSPRLPYRLAMKQLNS
jgi:D-aminoacyl-tRNA deacylase